MTTAEKAVFFTGAAVIAISLADVAPKLINGILILVLVGVFLTRSSAVVQTIQSTTGQKGS